MQVKTENLNVPTGVVDVILDTDTYNEIDDQFALAYLLLSPERIRPAGICAAPFLNAKSQSPADGMEKSYREIMKVLELMGREDAKAMVYRGSGQYLPDEKTPVVSPAAEYMAAKAGEYTPERPLYIVALGAITNVASAILLAPEAMTRNTVIVWLGGHALEWPDNREFNLRQDIAGARVLFGSGAPVVQLPCCGVVSEFRTTEGELKLWLEGKNPISDYLCRNTIEEAESYAKGTAWSRCIWDVTAVAWLLNDGNRFMNSYLIPAPIPEYDGQYALRRDRHPIRYVYQIKRDALFTDLFRRLAAAPRG